jgi:hypothetical protein
MIRIACPSDSEELQNIMIAAFERSCGVGAVRCESYAGLIEEATVSLKSNSKNSILVLVSPPEEYSPFLISILKTTKAKIIIFGSIPPLLAQFLNMQVSSISAEIHAASECGAAPIYQFSESTGYIEYVKGLGKNRPPVALRALRRYDYSNEWNNLGFGAITTDGSIWSLSHCANLLRQNALAYLRTFEEELSVYCALWDYQKASLLWFNREVGPIDSYEWRLIEIYISQYRFHDLPAWPVLLEVPYGYDGAVTMRLDCDEDVESARALYDSYKRWGIPFSLALHAAVLADPKHHHLPYEVINTGGAVLSHTLTHAPNWGGSQSEAMHEGNESASIINKSINIIPRYAVSPFHQTPFYARLGLAQAGYQGCIGGIIANDPDFVMARGGRPPYSDSDFIGHTQQCMLHGDCLLKEGDPLAIYKRAFDQSFEAMTLFGYLDHPFSKRYQYGWTSEKERIKAHLHLIQYIKIRSSRVLFLNENDALDFLYTKSHVKVELGDGKIIITSPLSLISGLAIGVEYGHHLFNLGSAGLIL